MTARVDVDWSQVQAGMAKLADGVARGSRDAAADQASRTADALRAATPVLSGALASTIGVTVETDGASVTYGGGLPYASYIANKSGNVETATADADTQWHEAATTVAEKEVRAL